MMRNRMKILGLTGGIAAGKSAVSNILRQNNGYILDADEIAHDVIIKGNPAYGEIISAIPGEYLSENGEIDRKRLGKIVFAENRYLRALELIVHTHVKDRISSEISSISQNPEQYEYIVIDAPLLFESGLHRKCDYVWIVQADEALRAERLMNRDGLTKEQAERRISIQGCGIPADGYTFINNNRSALELKKEVLRNLAVFRSNKWGKK